MKNVMTQFRSTFGGLAFGVVLAALIIGIFTVLQDEEKNERPRPAKITKKKRERKEGPEVDSAILTFSQRSVASDRLEGPRHSAYQLFELLNTLPDRLNEAEAQMLLDWLPTASNDSSLTTGESAHLFNEVVNHLRQQDPLPEGFAQVLNQLANNEEEADLIRDYALQQLRPLWAVLDSRDDDRAALEKTLWTAAESKHPSRSGTAFLALHQLGRQEGPIPKGERAIASEDLVPIIEETLSDSTSPSSMKMTALRMIEERGLAEQLETVRGLLADSSLNLPSQLKAISVISRLGSAADRDLLARLSDQPRLQLALDRAFQNLPK